MKSTLAYLFVLTMVALGSLLAAQGTPAATATPAQPAAAAQPANAKALIDALGMVSSAITEFPQAVAAATGEKVLAQESTAPASKPGEAAEETAAAPPAAADAQATQPNGEPTAVQKRRPVKNTVLIITSGAATGAAIGAAVTKNSKGAIVGAVAGAVAGLIYDRATYKNPGVI